MDELKPATRWKEMLPLVSSGCEIRAMQPNSITAVMPLSGQAEAVSVALIGAVGLGFPQPNRAQYSDDAMIIWMGPDQAFVLGAAIREMPNAAVVDQSDGWAVFQLKGPASEDVLARLVPVDFRQGVFDVGHTARTTLFHVPSSITRTATDSFVIMVYRSMAETAIGELADAISSVAARNGV